MATSGMGDFALETLEVTGHLPHLTAPDAVISALARHVGSAQGRSA